MESSQPPNSEEHQTGERTEVVPETEASQQNVFNSVTPSTPSFTIPNAQSPVGKEMVKDHNSSNSLSSEDENKTINADTDNCGDNKSKASIIRKHDTMERESSDGTVKRDWAKRKKRRRASKPLNNEAKYY